MIDRDYHAAVLVARLEDLLAEEPPDIPAISRVVADAVKTGIAKEYNDLFKRALEV